MGFNSGFKELSANFFLRVENKEQKILVFYALFTTYNQQRHNIFNT